MSLPDIQIALDDVQKKLKRLLDKHFALQKENRQLQADNKNLQSQLAVKEEEIRALTQQTDVLKSGIKQWHPEQKKVFVKRIDAYLKEIEKCLALINE